MDRKKILLGVTASIAAYKSCDIINALKRLGHEVQVVMSPDAKHFITPLTLETLSCNKVATDMFEPAVRRDAFHVSLAEWADLILVAPASADIIARLACGSADCLLSATLLSSTAKVLLAPAMNEKMYKHKAVRENIAKLKKFGYKFVGPKCGRLACGYVGMGHIADVDEIIGAAKRLL